MKCTAVCVVMLAAASVHAQPEYGLWLEFSAEGSVWTDNVAVAPGDSLQVRVRSRVPEAYPGGIASARYNIASVGKGWNVGGYDTIDLSLAKGDPDDGRMQKYDDGPQKQAQYGDGDSLRLDALGDYTNNPNAGISTRVLSPPQDCDFGCDPLVATIFKFRITLNKAKGERFITLTIADGVDNGTVNQITSFNGFRLENGDWKSSYISGARGDTGTIHVIPATPSILLAIPILAMRRRGGRGARAGQLPQHPL